MDTIKDVARIRAEPISIFLRAAVVLLSLTTAAIHASLGGLLFTITAVGYATLAAAMILPGAAGRSRWLIRLALLGFTAATIGGWLIFGARFPLAYLDKSLEFVLISFLALEIWTQDGGFVGVAERARRLVEVVVVWARALGHR